MCDRGYKPGSVLTAIYLDAMLPLRSSHPLQTVGPTYCLPTVLLRIEFTASQCSHVTGELLPRLSTLTVFLQRFISVALFLKSPSAGVTRYSCPVEPGLSSCRHLWMQARGCPPRSHFLLYFIFCLLSNISLSFIIENITIELYRGNEAGFWNAKNISIS